MGRIRPFLPLLFCLLFDFSQRANLLSICFIIPTQFYDTGLLLISKKSRLAEVTRVSLTPTSFSTSSVNAILFYEQSKLFGGSSSVLNWIIFIWPRNNPNRPVYISFYACLLTYSEHQQDLQRASPHPISGKVELNYTQNKSIQNVKVVVAPVCPCLYPDAGPSILSCCGWLEILLFRIGLLRSLLFLQSCQSSITWAGKQNILNCLE